MKDHSQKDSSDDKKSPAPALPPMEFSSLVTPFYIQALLALESVKEAKSPEDAQQLKLAQRLIDLLDLLKTKTDGHLEPEELQVLDGCLIQLKMLYLQKKEAR